MEVIKWRIIWAHEENYEPREQVYANSMEKMFRDANRPRDQYGFKIIPWKQMEAFDFHTSIKNFYLDQFIGMGVKIIPSGKLWEDTFDTEIPLVGNITDKEKEDIETYTKSTNWDSQKVTENILSFSNQKKQQKSVNKWSCATIKDWKIVIIKPWTYYIQYVWNYYFPVNFNSNTIPYQKLYSKIYSIKRDENNNEIKVDIQRNGKHIVFWWNDTSNDLHISAYKKWQKIWFETFHTAWDTTLVAWIINVIRFGL